MNSQELRQQLQSLNEISKELMHCQSIEEGVEIALAEVCEKLDVQVASVFLLSKDGVIKRVGINGIDKEGQPIDNSWFSEEQYEPGESFSGKAIPPFDAESVYGEPQYSNNLAQEYNMGVGTVYIEKLGELTSGISVPLNGAYRSFGTLQVLNKKDQQKFDYHDVYWLMLIGTSLANFISSFKARESFEFIKELINKLVELEVAGSNFNLTTVYNLVAKQLISDSTPYQACIIRIANDQEDLEIKAKNFTNKIYSEDRKDGSVKAGSQIVREVYKTRKPIYIEDIDDIEIQKFNNKKWVKQHGLKSFACLPLSVKDRCVGTITVYTNYNHKFYESYKVFLQQIAFLTAAITSKVQIIRELRKITKERNEMRVIVMGGVGFDNLYKSLLHQYKNELINFFQILKRLNGGNFNNKDKSFLQAQEIWMNERIEELEQELKTDEPLTVNINEAIKEVIRGFSFNYSDLNIQIELKTDAKIPTIALDEKNIKSIILNLLANAEKSIQTQQRKFGKIIIETSINTSEIIPYIQITVTDNGTGIKNEIRDQIFEKGFTTQKDKGGTGLGLYFVKEILNSYGGKIDFTSKVGEGTTFYVKIPYKRYLI